MKAYVFNEYGNPDSQEFIERETPAPGEGQMLVEVKASGVNPIDFKVRDGLMGTDGPLPYGFGVEAAGVVTAVGEGVTRYKVGDEVFGAQWTGLGTYTGETILFADEATRKPEGLSFEEAAVINVAPTTAYSAFTQTGLDHALDEGEDGTVVIAGIGPVGYYAAQFAEMFGYRVVVVARENKRALIERRGYSFVDSGEGLEERLAQAVPEKADLVFDTIGPAVFPHLFAVAKETDRVLTSAAKGDVDKLGGQPLNMVPEKAATAARLAAEGKLDLRITDTFTLDEADKALDLVENGHPEGKVVISMGEER